jgi:hypothetical protein
MQPACHAHARVDREPRRPHHDAACAAGGQLRTAGARWENAMVEQKEIQLQVQLDDDIAQGMYVNMAMVNHTETEFTVDFIFLQPQQPKAKVRSRIITSPKHAKRLLLALQENLARFESRFGAIDLSGPAPGEVNMH